MYTSPAGYSLNLIDNGEHPSNNISGIYSAWATEMGVAATGSDRSLDGDDNCFFIDIGFPLFGEGTFITTSNEGTLGIRKAPGSLAGQVKTSRTPTGVSRGYDAAALSDIFFTFHPTGVDAGTTGAKIRTTATASIIYGVINNRSGSDLLEYCIKISTGRVEFVLKPLLSPVNFAVFDLGDLAFTAPLSMPVGASRHLVADSFGYEMAAYRVALSPLIKLLGPPTPDFAAPSMKGVPSSTIHIRRDSGHVSDLLSGMLGEGIGRVRGTVKLKAGGFNPPWRRKVRLVRERDGQVIREQWSDAVTGEYDFRYIDEKQIWTVLAYDHTLEKQAVVAAGICLATAQVTLLPRIRRF